MVNHNFKVGDRVESIKRYKVKIGSLGTIRMISGDSLGVEWDDKISGHNLNGHLKNMNGWYLECYEVKIAVELSKSERKNKIKKIIKEINENKDYKDCFDDVEKEVNDWSDYKIKRW